MLRSRDDEFRPLGCTVRGGRVRLAASACDSGPSAGADGKPDASDDKASDSASDSTKVCEHLVEVATKSGADESVAKEVRSDCLASLDQLEKRYASLTTCLLDASTIADVEDCENPARRYESLLRAITPSPQKVCEHFMDLMEQEMPNVAPTPADRSRELAKCREHFEEEQQKLDPASFRTQAKCVVDAETIENLMKCES